MDKKRFLKIISDIESSGGKNKNHEVIKKGVNKGQRAGGAYGIVPGTLGEFYNRARNRNYVLPQELSEARGLGNDEMTKALTENPVLDDQAAEIISDIMLKESQGDPDKAAYGWNSGFTGMKEVSPETRSDSKYVKKFKTLKNKMGSN